MGLNEKQDYNRNSNQDDDDEDNERKDSSMSDISHEQIFMPLSPTPDSLSSFKQSTISKNKTNNNNNYNNFNSNSNNTINIINKQPVIKINSPKSLNEGGGGGSDGSRLGAPLRGTVTQSVTNTPIRKTRAPISTNQLLNNPINKQSNNKNPLNDDFLNTFFELDPLLDDYDVNLYAKNFHNYNNTNYHTPRLIDYDEDYLVFDRIKQRIAKRDLSIINRKTPFLNDNNQNNKELNVKIDITTEGAKVRELTKSRNSNVANTNINNRLSNSRVLNIDYINDYDYRKNTLAGLLPSISNNNNNNIKSNRLKKELANNNGNLISDFLFSTPVLFNNDDDNHNTSMKSVDALKNPNIHEYLYSLSKKTQFDTGYVDAFKEAQRRKSKAKPIYTIEDYRKFETNFNLGKDIIDETDTDKLEKTKKRNDYANYVRNRNSQILNELNPKEITTTRRSLPVNNRLAPLDHNKRFKETPKQIQKINHHTNQKSLTHIINN